MRGLVHQRVVEKGIEGEVRKLLGVDEVLRDGNEDHVVLRFHHVSQQDELVTVSFANPLVVRKVEGQRLHARTGVTCGHQLVNHRDRARGASSEVPMTVVHRERTLELLGEGRHPIELRRRLGIADCDEGFESRLEAHELVLVNFVRADYDLHRSIAELHPRYVALEVIVCAKSLGPQPQIAGKALVRGGGGPLLEQASRPIEGLPVVLGIRNGPERLSLATDDGEVARQCRALFGVCGEVLFEGLLGEILRIERSPCRARLRAHEGLGFVEPIPRAVHDVEIGERVGMGAVLGEPRPHGDVFLRDLTEIELVHHLSCLNELLQDGTDVVRDERIVDVDLDGGELCKPLRDV